MIIGKATYSRISHHKKYLKNCLIVMLVCQALYPYYAFANPELGAISSGSATVTNIDKTTIITQTSEAALIDWRSFNIAPDETTHFIQPSSSSFTVNRINDVNPSRIFGSLTANGNIILLNPNGILFGAGSRIDVNGIVASTANISNADFMSGAMKFDNFGANPNASIINQGTITAKDAGLVGLVAPNVRNSGIINAKLGRVYLAGADAFTVDFYGDGLVNFKLSDAVQSQIVENSGTINAEGGVIQMSAVAGRNVVNSLIDVRGNLNANSIEEKNGKIFIKAEGANSKVNISGNIDVSGKKSAGEVDVKANKIAITNSANIDASATDNGNGGKVIIFAEDETKFDGKIIAKGGENGGDGGFVETSAKNILSVNGTVDASSNLGKKGQWLLDPTNVIIQNAAGTGVVTTSSIQSALNGGTDVEILTSASGTDAGNITLNNAISKTLGGDATLTLKAIGSIIINSGAHITSTSNKLHVVLNSNINSNATTGGAISITGATINSNGGNITLGGGTNATGAAQGTSTLLSGITLSGATLNSGNGNITLRGVSANVANSQRNGVSILANSLIESGNGNIDITGTATGGASQNPNSPYGGNNSGILMNSSTIQNSGSGNVTLSGTYNGIGYGGSGILLSNSNILMTSTSSGSLSVTGTTNETSQDNAGEKGLSVDATSSIKSLSTSSLGSVTINGYGTLNNSSSVGNSDGVYVGGNISTTNNNLTINGRGGDKGTSNYGIFVDNTGSVTSLGSGNIILNASALSGATHVASSGARNINLRGSLSNNSGSITLNSAGKTILNSSYNPQITTSGGDITFNTAISILFSTFNEITNTPVVNRTPVIDTTNSGGNSTGGNVTFNGAINGMSGYSGGVTDLTVTSGSTGSTTFNGAVGRNNGIGNLNITSGGGVEFNQNITANNINASTTSGNGDIVIAANTNLTATATSGNSIVLATKGDFINHSQSDTLYTSGTARWVIYSENPAHDQLGGIHAPIVRYNNQNGYNTSLVTDTGNVLLYFIDDPVVSSPSNISLSSAVNPNVNNIANPDIKVEVEPKSSSGCVIKFNNLDQKNSITSSIVDIINDNNLTCIATDYYS